MFEIKDHKTQEEGDKMMGNERRAVDLRKTQWWRKWERRQMRGKGERKTGVRRGGNKEKGQDRQTVCSQKHN